MRIRVSRLRRWRMTSWPAACGMRCVNPSIAIASPSRILASTASASDISRDMGKPVLAVETFFTELPADVKALVISGEGEHFSAGLDLGELTRRDIAASIAHSRMWHRAFDAIEFGRVPVVCALHGAVVGGGLELAAATHVRVAERSAYYALPAGRRGLYL